ncbi:zn-finger in ran binding protein and others domain-containing protein [Cystoisospora suis]|uniref:Zn-finger in ran binding protein and others domain-containing protein n=1 Tax=Cystoisospora suis TaxID=483139 RepID=A0A2C6KU75_9APIC|nr:zn-finger in ran binding protein and others domain-containing protein [Cystoisospora suis]
MRPDGNSEAAVGSSQPQPGGGPAASLLLSNASKQNVSRGFESDSPAGTLSGVSTPQTLSGSTSFRLALGGAADGSCAVSSGGGGRQSSLEADASSMLYADVGVSFLHLAVSSASSTQTGDAVATPARSPSNLFASPGGGPAGVGEPTSCNSAFAAASPLSSVSTCPVNGGTSSALNAASVAFPSFDVVGAATSNFSRGHGVASTNTTSSGLPRGTAREPPRMGEGGNWRCNSCNNINYPRRKVCNRCGHPRSAENDLMVAEFTRLKDELQSMGLDHHTASQAAAAQQAAQQQGRRSSPMLDLLTSAGKLGKHQNRSKGASFNGNGHKAMTDCLVGTTDDTEAMTFSGLSAGGGLYSPNLFVSSNSTSPLSLCTNAGASVQQGSDGKDLDSNRCDSTGGSAAQLLLSSTSSKANAAATSYGSRLVENQESDPASAVTSLFSHGPTNGSSSSLGLLLTAAEHARRNSLESDAIANAERVKGGPDALSPQYTALLQLMLLKAKDVADALVACFRELGDPEPANRATDVLITALAILGHSPEIPGAPSNVLKCESGGRGAASGGASGNGVRGVGGPNFAAPTMLAHPDEFKNPSSFLKIYGDPLCTSGDVSGSAQNPVKNHHGNWVCRNCKNVNFPRRFRCNKCGEVRDEEGDRVVAEYAKLVHHHHLKAYKHLAASSHGPPSWILSSERGGHGRAHGDSASNQQNRKNRNRLQELDVCSNHA